LDLPVEDLRSKLQFGSFQSTVPQDGGTHNNFHADRLHFLDVESDFEQLPRKMEDDHFPQIPEIFVLDLEDVPELSCSLEEMTSFGDWSAVLSIDRQH
jgi:hypothetical protein